MGRIILGGFFVVMGLAFILFSKPMGAGMEKYYRFLSRHLGTGVSPREAGQVLYILLGGLFAVLGLLVMLGILRTQEF